MRGAVVGCGAVAEEYAPDVAAHPDLDLVAAADRVRERRPLRVGSPARAARLVTVVDATGRAADAGGPITPVDTPSFDPPRVGSPSTPDPTLPPVGVGAASYRGGETYVDLRAGIRRRSTPAVACSTAPSCAGASRSWATCSTPRGAFTLVSKVWHTNHASDDLRAACRASRERLGVDRLDAYLLHGTEAWAHQGAPDCLADRSHAEREALTFPTDARGDPLLADVSLAETWDAMEGLVADGRVPWLGVCNVGVEELAALHDGATVPPRVVQVEHHPRAPGDRLVEWCHDHGAAVMGHTPLGPDGLLETVRAVAGDEGLTPAGAVLWWSRARGVVPIPSTSDPAHGVANLDLFERLLSPEGRARLDDLA